MRNFVYLVFLLLCVCSHTTSGGENPQIKTSMFEDHRPEKYTTKCPICGNDTWKLTSVFFLSLAWSPVNKTYVLCLIYHEKNSQHQIVSHLIASQIVKNYTLIFFIGIIHYTLFNYKLLFVT